MRHRFGKFLPLFSHVVILNGTGGSGKSTLVDICDEISKGENIDVFVNELSSIDPIRNAVSNIIAYSILRNLTISSGSLT